jgi:hypothetical protein
MGSLKLIFNGKIFLGAALVGLFTNLSIISNHLQMTYYIFIAIGIWVAYELIIAIKNKKVNCITKPLLYFIASVCIGILPNYTALKANLEYTPSTIRGGSELSDSKAVGNGLDLDYALAWSYGKLETMTLIIPNFMGGSSTADVPKNSEIAKLYKANGVSERKLKDQQFPYYWGDVDFTGGPFYFGIIVVFLFVLGMFLLDDKLKWWIFTATLLLLFLSWGRNFIILSEFCFRFIPLYNKFRSVNMALIIPSILVPLLSFITLQRIFNDNLDTKKTNDLLKKVGLGFVILLVGVLLLGPGMITSPKGDAQMQEVIQEAVNADRAMIMRNDTLKALMLLCLAIGVLWAYMNKKLKSTPALIAIACLITFDLWYVGKEYLNSDDFTAKKELKDEFAPRPWELEILKDKTPNFRVADLTKNFTQDSRTSYYFNSLSGYHGSKSARYQDLITAHLSKQNEEVFNMLNTRYFIAPTGKGKEPIAQLNQNASGPAWYVKQINWVNNADEEINALNPGAFKYKDMAIVDTRFEADLKGFQPQYDSTSIINLITYDNNKISYVTNTKSDQFAVFSETYYQPGWTADIDGKETTHVRANYVLRAMKVPAGQHTITFTMNPPSYKNGKPISIAGSFLLLIMIGLGVFMEVKSNRNSKSSPNK